MVKRARPGSRAEERRRRLVEAAYESMLRSGLAAVRTRDVASEAGITVGTLHYYFPTKEDLVRAVLEYAIRERIVLPLENSRIAEDGAAELRAMLNGLRRQAEEEPGHFRLLHEMIWASHDDPAIRTMLSQWHSDWHASIVHNLETGQRDGSVRDDLDPAATAAIIMYLTFGMVLRPPMPEHPATQVTNELDRLLASLG